MEKVFIDFFSIAKLNISFSILIYFLGYIISLFIKNKQDSNTKENESIFTDTITIGFFATVFFTAIIYTKGNTSLIAPITAIVFMGLYLKIFTINIVLQPIKIKQLLFFILVFCTITFGMVLLLNFDNRLLMHNDISFYARLSHNMANFNLEKVIIDPLIIAELPSTIYHFFNEWLTVIGVKFLSNVSALKIFILFTLPSLTTLLFFNIHSISHYLLKYGTNVNKILFTLMVLFSPGILNFLVNFLLKGNVAISYSILHGGILFLKIKIILLIMLISLKLYIEERKQFSMVLFSLIPIFWNSLIPAFLGGFIVMLIYNILNKKSTNKSVLYTYIISFGVFAIYLFLNFSKQENTIHKYSLLQYLKDEFGNINYTLKVVSMLLISLLPLILLIIPKAKKYFNNEFKIYVLFICVAALMSFSLMHNLFNAKQIISNLFYPLFVIVLLLILSCFFNKYKIVFKSISLLLLTLLFIHTAYFFNVKQITFDIPSDFKNNKNLFTASDLYNNHSSAFAKYVRPYSYQMLEYKYWLPQRIDLIDNLNFKSNVEKMEFSGKEQSFFQFANSKCNPLNSINSNEIKAEFLKKYKFNYILVYKNDFEEGKVSYLKDFIITSSKNFDKNVLLIKFTKK